MALRERYFKPVRRAAAKRKRAICRTGPEAAFAGEL
jgi:hypothetical protein